MVIINVLIIFKYSIIYELNKVGVVNSSETHISAERFNEHRSLNGADLNSSEIAVATL